jgi:hypothetical protein
MISLLIAFVISSVIIVYTFTRNSDSGPFGEAIHVANEEQLRAAVNGAEKGKSVVIVFDKDISLTNSPLIIPADKNIILTSNGKTGFKLIGATDSGLHAITFGYETINVENGGMLELAGVIVTHVNDVNAFGVGVYVQNGGICIMTGGEISGNRVTGNGAGVCNVGTFELRGGVISGNVALSNGGGVLNVGSFSMSGGKIFNNTANEGGGIYINGGDFNLSGGEISGNTAKTGDAVYNRDGAFNRSGGEISGNITEQVPAHLV